MSYGQTPCPACVGFFVWVVIALALADCAGQAVDLTHVALAGSKALGRDQRCAIQQQFLLLVTFAKSSGQL